MTRSVRQRRTAARRSMFAWYAQVPIVAFVSYATVVWAGAWVGVAVVYLNLISVWTGIESAHARLNADL